MPQYHESQSAQFHRWSITVGSAFGYSSVEYKAFLDAFFEGRWNAMKTYVTRAYAIQERQHVEHLHI